MRLWWIRIFLDLFVGIAEKMKGYYLSPLNWDAHKLKEASKLASLKTALVFAG